jgi:hypothetical protein
MTYQADYNMNKYIREQLNKLPSNWKELLIISENQVIVNPPFLLNMKSQIIILNKNHLLNKMLNTPLPFQNIPEFLKIVIEINKNNKIDNKINQNKNILINELKLKLSVKNNINEIKTQSPNLINTNFKTKLFYILTFLLIVIIGIFIYNCDSKILFELYKFYIKNYLLPKLSEFYNSSLYYFDIFSVNIINLYNSSLYYFDIFSVNIINLYNSSLYYFDIFSVNIINLYNLFIYYYKIFSLYIYHIYITIIEGNKDFYSFFYSLKMYDNMYDYYVFFYNNILNLYIKCNNYLFNLY